MNKRKKVFSSSKQQKAKHETNIQTGNISFKMMQWIQNDPNIFHKSTCLCCRTVLHHRLFLVRVPGGSGVLQPAVRRSKVSFSSSQQLDWTWTGPELGLNWTWTLFLFLQVRARRRPLHGLGRRFPLHPGWKSPLQRLQESVTCWKERVTELTVLLFSDHIYVTMLQLI